MGSLGKDSNELEAQCSTKLCQLLRPRQAAEQSPGPVLWGPRMANPNSVPGILAPWWTYLVWHPLRAWVVVQLVAWEFIKATLVGSS